VLWLLDAVHTVVSVKRKTILSLALSNSCARQSGCEDVRATVTCQWGNVGTSGEAVEPRVLFVGIVVVVVGIRILRLGRGR
jgi:hypothetical protein